MRSTLILVTVFALLVLALFVQTNLLESALEEIDTLKAQVQQAREDLGTCESELESRETTWAAALDSLGEASREANRRLRVSAAHSEVLSARASELAVELLIAQIPDTLVHTRPDGTPAITCEAASAWMIDQANRLSNWYP